MQLNITLYIKIFRMINHDAYLFITLIYIINTAFSVSYAYFMHKNQLILPFLPIFNCINVDFL